MYYTYIYFNPLKQSRLHECGLMPFYVGKGKHNRSHSHLRSGGLEKDPNKHKVHIIKQILDAGLLPIIITKKWETEQDAYNEEKRLIRVFGRADKKEGPLTNMTDGGEGQSGRVFTEVQKLRISASTKLAHATGKLKTNTEKWYIAGLKKAHSPEGRRKSAIARTGIARSEKTKIILSEKRREFISTLSEDQRKQIFGTMLGKKHSNASKQKMSKSISAACQRADVKEARSKANTGAKNPRAKRISVFSKEYDCIKDASSQLKLTPYVIKKEKTFFYL